jgi:hypothetical protein
MLGKRSLQSGEGTSKKGRTVSSAAFGEVLRGGGKILGSAALRLSLRNCYIDGGADPVADPFVVPWPSIVFVISLMLTRRLAARPSRVLFSSTGLSFPRPIK